MKALIWINLLLSAFGAWSQNIPIGTWRTHPSFASASIVTGGNDRVFCASGNSLFFINLENGSLNILDKTNGLSDAGITAMKFYEDLDLLAIGYQTGVVDLIEPNKVTSISTFRDAKIISSKRINDFEILGNTLFCASDFGVATVDLQKGTARDVFHEIGPAGEAVSAHSIYPDGTNLYALTNLGVLGGNTNANLLDFNNWELIQIPLEVNARQLFKIDEELFLIDNHGQVWKKLNSEWALTHNSDPIAKAIPNAETTYLLSSDALYLYQDDTLKPTTHFSFDEAKDGCIVNEQWYVATTTGLATETGIVKPNGPELDQSVHMAIIGDDLWLFYASASSTHLSGWDSFDGNTWLYNQIEGISSITDAVAFNGEIILAGANTLYNLTNNTWSDLPGNGMISSLNASADYLWATTYDDQKGLHMMSVDGFWESYDGIGRFPVDLVLSYEDIAWIKRDNVEAGTIAVASPLENLYGTIRASNGIPSEGINDITIDLNDEAWVVGEKGAVFLPDASYPFDTPEAYVPFFEGVPLFEGEKITSIAIDGGNRKWFGTTEGLMLFDENINTRIHHFNESNSPLPSNNIQNIAFNHITGELFVLTDRGLVSYQTNSAIPIATHQEVEVFPNPVSISRHSSIAFKGLAYSAQIKVTTVDGQLVGEFESNGSLGSWDLKHYAGGTISPGIYLFFSTTPDGKETFVGKFAVVQ
ncbi:MAG: hypothetical protein JXQ90_12900 [Cyclobacteriaceae bacterium]